ncbi:TNF receptor-associated factor 4-like isoform X2 [Stylophora pistillata]|uniref:TNF receptor-associated factor 4-like isoform X2 n=1 Tax=Stylophora pistillata TaxID=50429 RepID=UPI000C03A481|nr:TNF receptor-associated factor 4-like isoform X2 [Stylophora pistillata]
MEAVYEDFQCPICHLPLKEPVQTRCGHRYCKGCLDEDIRRKRSQGRSLTCPSDRQNLDPDKDIFPDKATERKILSLAIRCPNDSCGWTGELRNKEVHLRSCPVHQVLCSNKNCGVIVIRRLLKQHETLRCVWRILQCTHCSESHPACKMPEHFKQCNKFPVTCPNNCGRSVSRDMVSTHTEDECPRTILSCPFARVGCKQKVQRQEMESHLDSTTRVHLDFTYSKNNNTEDELMDTKTKLIETKAELSKTKAELSKTKAELSKTKAELSKTKVELSETKVELKEAVKQLKLLSVKHTNSFLWRIDGFSEILKRAQTDKDENDICSDPFYTKIGTESYGYKLKVEFYPNGFGNGKNTHLSVSIIVMKGEYDVILPWPFAENVKLTLIDQQENPGQRQNKTKEFVGKDLKSFARPVTDENIGWGFDEFVSREELYARRFIVDDTLFLQVEIKSTSS